MIWEFLVGEFRRDGWLENGGWPSGAQGKQIEADRSGNWRAGGSKRLGDCRKEGRIDQSQHPHPGNPQGCSTLVATARRALRNDSLTIVRRRQEKIQSATRPSYIH
jgi:hypothetical protein